MSTMAMRQRWVMVGAVGLAVVFAAALQGCRGARVERKMEKRFAEVDRDGDGRLSREEFAATRVGQRAEDPDAAFARVDADGDGRLSREEMRAAIAARRGK